MKENGRENGEFMINIKLKPYILHLFEFPSIEERVGETFLIREYLKPRYLINNKNTDGKAVIQMYFYCDILQKKYNRSKAEEVQVSVANMTVYSLHTKRKDE